MEFENLTSQMPESEPKMRVYDNYATLNAAAVQLLGLEQGDYVQFVNSPRERINGKPLLFIRKTTRPVGSVQARKRGKTMVLSSRRIAGLLREQLSGAGCYRICPEDCIKDLDGTYYNVFFRNYGN